MPSAPRGPRGDPPFQGLGWISDRLYRVVGAIPGGGEWVDVDGWDEVLDAAWRGLLHDHPALDEWLDALHEGRGDVGLIVEFTDTRRLAARRRWGDVFVFCPAGPLVEAVDRDAAMRAAIVDVIDRFIEKGRLDVPSLRSVVGDG